MKKFLAMILAIIMVLAAMIPTVSFAEGEETFTVAFNMNGRGGTVPDPLYNVPKGSKITAPASPNCDEIYLGYDFIRWGYYEGTRLLEWDFEENTVTKDIELIAVWGDFPAYQVTLKHNDALLSGATLKFEGVNANEGYDYTFTETDTGVYRVNACKPGKYNVYVNDEFINYTTFVANAGTTSISVSIDLWDFVFDANGQAFTDETAPAMQRGSYCFSYKNRVTRPADPVAKDPNYRFVKWTVGPEVDSEAFDFTRQYNSKATIYAQWALAADEDTFPVTVYRSKIVEGNAYAKRGETYTVKLEPNSGYELPYRYTSHIFTTATYIKIGGEFLNTGSYTLNRNTGELTIPGQYVTGDIEIGTVPRKNPFHIYFNANGGTGTQEDDGAAVYITSEGYDYIFERPGLVYGWYKVPECTFTPPDGKMFAYWNYGKNNANKIYPYSSTNQSEMVFNDITYYAVWEDAPDGTYTVSYDLTGCTFSGGMNASVASDYTTTLSPKDGFALPITIKEVKVGGSSCTHSYNATTRTLTIPAASITGNISIKASAEKTYRVTYRDGVNEKAFTDQVTKNLKSGSDTPAFSGTPTREGYVFAGWSPQVASKVTADAVYTAQWKPCYGIYGVYDGVLEETAIRTDSATAGSKLSDVFTDASAFDEFGYTHTEFYKDAACTQKYAADAVITGGMKLYVKYETKYYTLTLPIVKTVVQGGSVAPPEESFQFAIRPRSMQIREAFVCTPIVDTIATNGANPYESSLSFKVTEQQYESIANSFQVYEVEGTADGWEYDDTVYTVVYDKTNDCVDSIWVGGDHPVTSIAFTNTYTRYSILASAETGGSITPNGETLAYRGDTVDYTISVDDDHLLSDVLVDGVSVGRVTEYCFKEITQDHTITVKVTAKTPPPPEGPSGGGQGGNGGNGGGQSGSGGNGGGQSGTGGNGGGQSGTGGNGGNQNTETNGKTDLVKTGDTANLGLSIVLLLAAAALGMGLIVCTKRLRTKK